MQVITLLLTIVGKLFEALEVFRTRFLSQPFSRAYLEQFYPRQREAVTTLKQSLGTSSLLASIRNDFAFHYHQDSDLSRFMASWNRGAASNDVFW